MPELLNVTKGFDPLAEVKAAAARRWVNAVNVEGSYGRWDYAVVRKPEDIPLRMAAMLYDEPGS